MRNIFLLAGCALLLLAGCAKEDSTELGGEQTAVTFTASMAEFADTKAAADGDGKAASVNRCIMEIYYEGSLYSRDIQPVSHEGETVTATFTAQIVANRTYQIAFWADHIQSPAATPTTAELDVDLYYETNGTNGLREIALAKDNSRNVTYSGNDDARDAFFAAGDYTFVQGESAVREVTLRRPFAQINVIITDWDQLTDKPDSVDVTINNPFSKFNALTGTVLTDSDVTSLPYKTTIYTSPTSGTDATLSMDYIFAAGTQAYINIDWEALKGDTPLKSYAFTSISYRRNYRTNIKASLSN